MLDGSSEESTARWVVTGRFGERSVAVTAHGSWWHRWDLTTGSALGDPIEGGGGWSTAVALASVGGRPVLVSGHKSICVRDLDTGEPLFDPIESKSLVHLLRVARWDGRDVAITMHLDGRVRVWDLATGEFLLGPMTDWAGTIAFLAHGDSVLAVIEDHPLDKSGGDYDFDEIALLVWDFYEGTKVCPPLVGGGVARGTLYPPMDIVSLPTGPALISVAGGDGWIWVWDVTTGDRIGEPLAPGAEDFVTAVKAFEVDGRVSVIAGTEQGNLHTWGLTTGAGGDPIGAHGGRIRGLAIAEVDGRTVAISAGEAPALRMWDLGSGAPVAIDG